MHISNFGQKEKTEQQIASFRSLTRNVRHQNFFNHLGWIRVKQSIFDSYLKNNDWIVFFFEATMD